MRSEAEAEYPLSPASPATTLTLPKGLARAELVQHYLRAAAGKGRRQGVLAAKQEFLAAYNTGLPWPELYRQIGKVSFATIERWAKKYKETAEPLALAPQRGRQRRGESSVSEEAAKILLAVALHPNRLRLSEVVRVARQVMAQQGIADGLSDRTYLRWLERFRQQHYDAWVCWRQGEQALHAECLPYLERDYSRLEVGDALVADGHRLNFEIINPWTGKPKRMVLIMFYDMKSNYPCGWEIMPEENTQAIAAAFRRALLTLGRPPKAVYLDNGKAFGARFFSTNLAEAGFAGLFNRLGVQVIYAWPYHGQSKTVERFFQVLGEFERLMPSYVGTGIDRKPPRLNRGEKLHRRLHEQRTGGAVPTLTEAHQAIAMWLADYTGRPQARSHLQGAAPREMFLEWRERQGNPEMDREELRYLMMAAERRTINRNGISLFGRHYYHPELYGRRHEVLVRYDLHDLETVYVYDQSSGEYICEATPVPGVHPLAGVTGTAADREGVAAQIDQKRRLLRRTTKAARQVAAVVLPRPELECRASARDQVKEMPRSPGIVEIAAIEEELQGRRQAAAEGPSADWRRYEALLEQEAAGTLEMDEAVFMRYYESGSEYRQHQEYFDGRRLEIMRWRREEQRHEL